MAANRERTRKAVTNGSKPAGSGVRAAGKNGPQVVKSDGKYWTDEAEAVFLDALAASCNVQHAAAACGYSHTTLYRRRREYADFAERWRAALAQGYVRIEALLIERAEDALSGRLPDPELPIAEMTVKEAMELLRFHHATVHGEGPRRSGRPAVVRPLEEVQASILAKLSAMDAHDAGR